MKIDEKDLKTVVQQVKFNTADNRSALNRDSRGYIGRSSIPHKGGLSNPINSIKKEGYATMNKFVELAHNKDASSFKDAFETSVAEKVFDTLEDRKADVARAMFNPETVQEDAEQIWEKNHPRNEETVSEEYHKLSDTAKELVLHADNDSHLYHSSHEPIMKNLAKKHAKGVYDSEKAKKLWGYHADRAAFNYHKQHGDKSVPWHKMFTPEHRKEAAAHWESEHREVAS